MFLIVDLVWEIWGLFVVGCLICIILDEIVCDIDFLILMFFGYGICCICFVLILLNYIFDCFLNFGKIVFVFDFWVVSGEVMSCDFVEWFYVVFLRVVFFN